MIPSLAGRYDNPIWLILARQARLHRLAESFPWNRFLGSLNVYKFWLYSSPTRMFRFDSRLYNGGISIWEGISGEEINAKLKLHQKTVVIFLPVANFEDKSDRIDQKTTKLMTYINMFCFSLDLTQFIIILIFLLELVLTVLSLFGIQKPTNLRIRKKSRITMKVVFVSF